MHQFIGQSRCWIEPAKFAPSCGGITRFLDQLAGGAGQGLFAGFEGAGGDLQERAAEGDAMISDHDHGRSLWGVQEREHDGRSTVADDLTAGRDGLGGGGTGTRRDELEVELASVVKDDTFVVDEGARLEAGAGNGLGG